MGKTGLDRMLVMSKDIGLTTKPEPSSGRTGLASGQGDARLTRRDANWTSDLEMAELVANGKRFAWRVCNECAKYDRLNRSCELLGERTNGGSGCDFWSDISC